MMTENMYTFAVALSHQLEATVEKELLKLVLVQYQERLEKLPVDYSLIVKVIEQLVDPLEDEVRPKWVEGVESTALVAEVSSFITRLVLTIGEVDIKHLQSCAGHQKACVLVYAAFLEGVLGRDVSMALVKIVGGMTVEKQIDNLFKNAMLTHKVVASLAYWGAVMQNPAALELIVRALGAVPPARKVLFLENMVKLVDEGKTLPSLENLEAMAHHAMGKVCKSN